MHVVVDGDLLRAARDDAHLQVVLQAAADARRIEHHVDAVLAQQFAWADAGQLQQLRRVVGAARDQHLPARLRRFQRAVLAILDAASPACRRTADRCASALVSIFRLRALARGTQICARRRATAAVARRGLVVAGAFLARAVEVVVAGDADLRRRLDERVAQADRSGACPKRSAGRRAVILALAPLLVLRPLEVRQDVLETPADIAELAPAVIVRMLAADIDEAVDRARATQHFSARLKHLPAVEPGLRLGRYIQLTFGFLNSFA